MARKGARLGQHFLRTPWAAERLVEAAAIERGDMVLEIGPGEGALTREIVQTGAHIVAIEKDAALAEKLKDLFRSEIASGQLVIISGDIRDFDPAENPDLKAGAYILAANIPYYITGEILRQFLTSKAYPRTLALLIQKEVADRIIARDKKESILSLSVKAYGTARIAEIVGRGHFSPPPSVDSAILVVEGISHAFFDTVSEERFFEIIKKAFSSKRKLLAGNLSALADRSAVMTAMENSGIAPNARAEDVPLEKWKDLCKHFPE